MLVRHTMYSSVQLTSFCISPQTTTSRWWRMIQKQSSERSPKTASMFMYLSSSPSPLSFAAPAEGAATRSQISAMVGFCTRKRSSPPVPNACLSLCASASRLSESTPRLMSWSPPSARAPVISRMMPTTTPSASAAPPPGGALGGALGGAPAHGGAGAHAPPSPRSTRVGATRSESAPPAGRPFEVASAARTPLRARPCRALKRMRRAAARARALGQAVHEDDDLRPLGRVEPRAAELVQRAERELGGGRRLARATRRPQRR